MMETPNSDGSHATHDTAELSDRRYCNGSTSPTLSSVSKNESLSVSSKAIPENFSIDSEKTTSPTQVSIRYDCDTPPPDESIRQKAIRSRGSLKHLYKRSSESALNKKFVIDVEQLRHLSHTSLNRIARESEARKSSASSESKAFIASITRRRSLDSNEVIRLSRDRLLHLGHSFYGGDTEKPLIEEYPTTTELNQEESNKQGKLSGIFRRRSGSSKSLGRKPTQAMELRSDSDTHLRRRASFGAVKRSNSFSNDKEVVRERDKALEEWGRAASKCEELIEELECTLTELILIKCDRDEKEQELQSVMTFYEHNMDERDKQITELHEQITQACEKIDVARRERTEAYEQRDELLQHSYKYAQEVEAMKNTEAKHKDERRNLSEQIKSYENQVSTLKSERDHAVKLWKETMEERKKVYDEQIVLAQAKDEALQKTFVQIEEINVLKSERDQLLRQIEHSQLSSGDIDDMNGQRKSDSGFLSATKIKHEDTSSDKQERDSTTAGMTKNDYDCRSQVISDDEEYEDIAICMDTLDSRVGWKLDNAFDEPRVLISVVTPQAEQKWNIKKHDRILSVNSTSVQRANKKTVERLIRDTTGRTISLVLRREKQNTGVKQHADIDIYLAKQHNELGLQCGLQIKRILSNTELSGAENLKEGDIITKINSQDTSEILSSMISKLIKKWSGRTTFRIKRQGGFHDDKVNSSSQESTPKRNNQFQNSLFNFSLRRKSSGASSDNSTPKSSIFTDISSLLSYSSDMRNISNEILDIGKDASMSVTPYDSNENVTPKNSMLISDKNSLQTQKEINRLSITTIHNSLEDISDPTAIPLRDVRVRTARRPKLRLPSFGATIGKSFSKTLTHAVSKDGTSAADGLGDCETGLESPCLYQLSRYATLPRSYQRKLYNFETRSSSRVIRINKEEEDPIGFGVCGGNRIGIFVKDLSPEIVSAGLKVGDRVLSINSSDLSKATLDFAMRVLLLHRNFTKIRMEVKHYPNFEELMNNKPYESLYVRCLQTYSATNETELSFDIGSILHVTDTLVGYDTNTLTWSWQGEKTRKKSKESISKGIVPWIEPFTEEANLQTPALTNSLENLDVHDKRKRRTLIKTAQDLKKWLSRKPSWGKRKQGRKSCSYDNSRKQNVYYEILLEEQVTV